MQQIRKTLTTIQDVLQTVKPRLKQNLEQRLSKKKLILKVPPSIACLEPCEFSRCMSSCYHEAGDDHERHVCSDHNYKVGEMSQQVVVPPRNRQADPLPSNFEKPSVVPKISTPDPRTEEDEELPVLVDSSSGSEPDRICLDTDSSDEEMSEPEQAAKRQRQQEQTSGHLDFDYYDSYLVRPSPQLKNHVRSMISTTWNIISEEYHMTGEPKRYPKPVLQDDAPRPDPKQVWWTDSETSSTVIPQTTVSQYYDLWRKFDAPKWTGPTFPKDLKDDDLKVARKEAASLPEKFYQGSLLPVITPDNVDQFVKYLQDNQLDLDQLSVHLWSWYSGTGRLARTYMDSTTEHAVLFPVDLRYGWDLQNIAHQNELQEIDVLFQPLVTTMEPRCKFWSIAGKTRHPSITFQQRKKEDQMLQFLVTHITMLLEKRYVAVENPMSSAIWTHSPLKQLALDDNTFCQCAHSAQPDGERSMKPTTIRSNFALEATCLQCTCQQGHIPLRGKLTAPAAAFSNKMCKSLVEDIKNIDVNVPHTTCPAQKRLRTADDLAKEAAQRLKPGYLKPAHLPCPYCENRYSSSASLRYHKATQHEQDYNVDRAKRKLPPVVNPITKRRTTTPIPTTPLPTQQPEEIIPAALAPAEPARPAEEIIPESAPLAHELLAGARGAASPVHAPQAIPRVIEDEVIASQEPWQPLPFSTAQRYQPPMQDQGTWQTVPEFDHELRRPQRTMVRNLLRPIQRTKRTGQATYAGGLKRARQLLGRRLLQRLDPTTNPVEEVPSSPISDIQEPPSGNPIPEGHSTPVREDQPQEERRPRGRPPNPRPVQQPKRRRMHKDDLDPYPDDFFAHLTAEDIADWNADDLLVGGDADLPPEARRCPTSVRRVIRNAHNNLGHPSNHALVRLMKTAKCHADMIAYARHMKCPSCQRRQPPSRIPRVAMPYRPTRFNAVVGLDLKWVKDSSDEQYYLLNILDLATTFNVCCVVPDKQPKTIADAFKQHWLNWASTPEKMVADKGTEYYTDFQAMLSDLGIQYRLVPVEAPWQHGMVERHGQVLADIIQVVALETGIKGTKQMQDLCLHSCMA